MRTNGPEKREESKDPEGTLTAPMGQRVKTWRRGILVGLEGRNPQGFTVRLGRGWSKMHFIHGDRAGTPPSFASSASETGWRRPPVRIYQNP